MVLKKRINQTGDGIFEELFNICRNAPLFPGDTISHRTAGICFHNNWVKRNDKGYWVPTLKGRLRYFLDRMFGVKR